MSKARLECGICFEETEQGAHSELCGVHFLCNACWAKLLARELVRKRKSPLMLRCPGARCAVRLTQCVRRIMSLMRPKAARGPARWTLRS